MFNKMNTVTFTHQQQHIHTADNYNKTPNLLHICINNNFSYQISVYMKQEKTV